MMRSIHFWPHDLRPATDPPTVPLFDDRLALAPAPSVPIPVEPPCLHQDRVSHGSTRVGNPRFRCKICTRSFVENPGNNRLKPAKAEALRAAFLSGIGIRAAAKQAQVAKRTAAYYRDLWAIEANCVCGRPAGHRGWCRERLRNSPKRQKVIAKLHGGVSDKDRECWRDVAKVIRKSARAFGVTDAALDAGLLMLAGLLVHFDLCRTVELTALAFVDVERFAARFREFGIWKGHRLCYGPDDGPGGDLHFWLDAMVGAGELECAGDSKAERLYGLLASPPASEKILLTSVRE